MGRAMKDSGIPWIGEIPEGWKILRNKNAFSCSKEIVGNNSTTTQLLSLTTKGVKEKGQEIVGGKVPESYDTYQTVRKGQLVMCLFDLDCSAVFSGLSPFDGMISPAYKVLDCKAGMDPSFASYWFSSVFDGRKFMHYAKNLRYTLTYDEFSVLPIVITSLDEQQRIADFLDAKCAEIDTVLEKTRASIDEYKKLKQSVITEAVTKGIRGERPMKDSGVEWIEKIPEEWNLAPIKQLFIRRSQKNNPIISTERLSLSIDIGITKYEEKTTNLDRFKDDFTEYQIAYPDDIVLNSMNMIVGAVGKSPYLGCVSPVYYVIYSRRDADMRYWAYLLNCTNIRDVYHSFGQGIYAIERGEGRVNTCRLKVPYDKFGKIMIPLPPLSEQHEIATYLDEKCAAIDSLIASKEALLTELEAYKKSLIYEYVTGKKEVSAQ